jgi:predicted RNase H-like nuclease (RuvC/YqgF family)
MMIVHEREGKMQGTVDAILQLAKTMKSDHRTVVTLTTTNAKLAAQLETYHAYINKLKEDIDDINANMKPAWQGQ